MPFLGAHMSIRGMPHKALLRGRDSECQAIQIFSRHRLKWSAKTLSESEVELFKKAKTETSIIPAAIHGSYLINPASPDDKLREKTFLLILEEMKWAKLLMIPYLVVHPGSHMGKGESKGIKLITEMINRVCESTKAYNVQILLETTAGQGTNLGYRFEHIAEIMGKSSFSDRLGVCFDTCHVFAAGYDFRTKESYGQILNEFDKIIGLNRLKLFHINDMKKGLKARRDRHEHPGEGAIGKKAFSFFLNDSLFADHVFILETPKGLSPDGLDRDIVNIRFLKSLLKDNRK